MSNKSEVIRRLNEAKSEANRFIEKADAAIDSVDTAGKDYYSDRKYAAAKRASLDLSATLADLRRSLYR
jgi:hypothetical protein